MKPRAALALLFAALLAWRVALAPAQAWRDVPAILALAGLASLFRKDAGLAAGAWLLGLYAAAHLPRLIEVFR
jgi:hypothetical protein